jgi:hypothetical protein
MVSILEWLKPFVDDAAKDFKIFDEHITRKSYKPLTSTASINA